MKSNVLCAVFMLAGGVASAATFSANGGAGTSVIDAAGTGDYLSLAAAAADFNGFAGGATGAATFLIRSDLTEPTSVNFGNNTNGNVVTVKPAPDTTPVVTFTATTRPATGTGAIWDASFLIGPRGFTDNSNFAVMTNFTIDGSNTAGGTTRDMSFVTPDVGGTQIQRIMVRIIGSSNNVGVKNLIIQNGPIGTGANTCVELTVRRDAGGVTHVPENGKVINCELTANNGGIGQGVVCTNAGTVAAGLVSTNLVVSDCDINVSLRAMLYNINAGGAITGNHIKITQFTATGNNRPEVIRHTASNGFAGAYTMEISSNTVSQLQSVATGGFNYVIGVGGSSGTPTYNIINNIITGFETTQTLVAPDFLNRAIGITTANSPGTYNIYHNSINMTDLPTIEGVDIKRRLSAISFISANGFTGTFNFENNIVRFSQHNGTLIASSPAFETTPAGVIGGTLNFNNNTYFLGNPGAQFAFLNDVAYATLADWQAGTPPRDTASNSADPFAPPAGGKWRSEFDLHFDNVADTVFRGAPQAAVLTDIDGDPRPPVRPTKGADEFVVGSSVNEWTLY